MRKRARLTGAGLLILAVAVVVFGSPRETQAPVDYSKFDHGNAQHARLPCLLCHRRESNATRPTLPGAAEHTPCTGCHAQQFADASNPICTVCHTDARSGAVKAFPRLRSFGVTFDHAKHLYMRGLLCVTCHRPARGGVAFSIPAGLRAHAVCYRCHTPGAKSGDRDISSCGVCHEPGRYSRTPAWARAFNMGFNHAEHGASQALRCNDCHKVRAGVPQRRQVSAPQAAHHHASGRQLSCMSCHDGNRAFGGDDFSVCTRCHTGGEWRFR